jgi:hypothetical protein
MDPARRGSGHPPLVAGLAAGCRDALHVRTFTDRQARLMSCSEQRNWLAYLNCCSEIF